MFLYGFDNSRAKESDILQGANQTEGLNQSVGCTLKKSIQSMTINLSPNGTYLAQQVLSGRSLYKRMLDLLKALANQ